MQPGGVMKAGTATAARPPLQAFGRPCGCGEDDPCAPLLLADGRQLQVRPLGPGDAAAEQAFVNGLSAQSRYRRFHAGIPELPPALLARMVDVDQTQHVALAAQVPGQDRIVADARYVRDDAGGAEFALTVADDWQGLGLGRQLLLRLARHARSQGVRQLRGDVLWDNGPMVGLVDRLGGRLHPLRGEPGVLQARFDTATLSA
jgi:acetyltransferase